MINLNSTERGRPEKGTCVLAHGAGAGSHSDFMVYFQRRLAEAGFRVILFDFPYMVKAREEGKKRPPDKAAKLLAAYRQILEELRPSGPLIIGGKSMGGRIASMLLAEDESLADGLLLLGYPFHPVGKPTVLRTDHLAQISKPALIVQGERDTFGDKALVESLSIPENFQLHWCPDGDHSFKPRKASGYSEEANREAALLAITQHDWAV